MYTVYKKRIFLSSQNSDLPNVIQFFLDKFWTLV